MYLHLGQNVVVPTKDVIGIFDLDNTTGSHITRAFLKNAEKAGQIVNISDDLPKSFIVCTGRRQFVPEGQTYIPAGCRDKNLSFAAGVVHALQAQRDDALRLNT